VLVDIPKDVQSTKTLFHYPDSVSLRSYNPVVKGHAGQIKKAIQLILQAKRPMVYAGGGVILGEADPASIAEPLYFMTDDEISRGANQVSPWKGVMYSSVVQPNHIESVITYLPTGPHRALEKWKYSRYFDNEQFWSDPGGNPPEDVVTLVKGLVDQAGTKRAVTTVKTEPVSDEIEAYNVTKDPLELDNLALSSDPSVQKVLALLAQTLQKQCEAKRLKPSSGTVPGQPDC
jgi:hypothetical protein